MQYYPVDAMKTWTQEQLDQVPFLELESDDKGSLHWANSSHVTFCCEGWENRFVAGLSFTYYQIYEDQERIKHIQDEFFLYSADKRDVSIYKLFRSKTKMELYAFQIVSRSIRIPDLVRKFIEEWQTQKTRPKKYKRK